MGAPDPFVHNAQNFRYGFLSAATSKILEKAEGATLMEDELRVLELAKAFLEDIIAGVRLVSMGESNSGSAMSAVRALRYTHSPLNLIDELNTATKPQGFLDFFKSTLSFIEDSLKSKSIAPPKKSREATANLFQVLSTSILSSMAQKTNSQVKLNSTTLP